MITLRKIAYCVGISITISVFVLFLYSALPNMIQHSDWDQFDAMSMNDEEMLEIFKGHPAYAAFYERFPDATEELDNDNISRHSELKVGVRNFDTGIELILHMYYNPRNDNVNVNINCDVQGYELNVDRSALHASELFAVDFIEQTNCLDLGNGITETVHNSPTYSYGPGGESIVVLTTPREQ